MADHGYVNFYTPPEYESYQQYQQYPSEDERLSRLENILNVFMQQTMINMQDTNQRLKNLSCHMEIMQAHIMVIEANIQSTHGEQENIPIRDEKVGEIVEASVDETEEDTILEGCGIMEIEEGIDMPHEVEFPQKRSYTEEAETVDNEEVMVVVEERLLSKKGSCEEKGKKVSEAEIDRVIDEICALFNKPKLRRIWTPHQLYLKFMEFLPKRRITKDDVMSVSFRPP